ncbi:MAG: serine--tRNA ligase [Acidobacteriota bacterium]
MINPKILREERTEEIDRIEARGAPVPMDRFRDLDTRRRKSNRLLEDLRHLRKKASEEIGRLKRGGDAAEEKVREMRQVGDQIQDLEKQVRKIDEDWNLLLLEVPNVPDPSVPRGGGPDDNPVVREWGHRPEFAFEPRPHWEIGERLGILDFERAAKITGARFAVYWGAGARLERALINFMLDLHTREHGYREILPPFLVNENSLTGTGNLPKFREDLFKVEGHDLFLIPTAEVPLTNLYSREILNAADLPIRLCAYTPCFRSEAGSYGKDTKGLVRQHQFNKVEMVKFVEPEKAAEELESLTMNAEEVLKRLDLHYRIIELCTGDLGFAAAKTYDLEVWLPSQNAYREISSCSNFGDFQARRAGIRYRPEPRAKPRPLHTLNGSGLAIGRTVIAILEQNQERDGSVGIPEALRPFCDGLEKISQP